MEQAFGLLPDNMLTTEIDQDNQSGDICLGVPQRVFNDFLEAFYKANPILFHNTYNFDDMKVKVEWNIKHPPALKMSNSRESLERFSDLLCNKLQVEENSEFPVSDFRTFIVDSQIAVQIGFGGVEIVLDTTDGITTNAIFSGYIDCLVCVDVDANKKKQVKIKPFGGKLKVDSYNGSDKGIALSIAGMNYSFKELMLFLVNDLAIPFAIKKYADMIPSFELDVSKIEIAHEHDNPILKMYFNDIPGDYSTSGGIGVDDRQNANILMSLNSVQFETLLNTAFTKLGIIKLSIELPFMIGFLHAQMKIGDIKVKKLEKHEMTLAFNIEFPDTYIHNAIMTIPIKAALDGSSKPEITAELFVNEQGYLTLKTIKLNNAKFNFRVYGSRLVEEKLKWLIDAVNKILKQPKVNNYITSLILGGIVGKELPLYNVSRINIGIIERVNPVVAKVDSGTFTFAENQALIESNVSFEGVSPIPVWLNAGEVVKAGHLLMSPGGNYILSFQTDGEIIVYGNASREIVWRSFTKFLEPTYLQMSMEGNLELLNDDKKILWSVSTQHKGAALRLDDVDGALLVSPGGKCITNLGRKIANNAIENNVKMKIGSYIDNSAYAEVEKEFRYLVLRANGTVEVVDNDGKSKCVLLSSIGDDIKQYVYINVMNMGNLSYDVLVRLKNRNKDYQIVKTVQNFIPGLLSMRFTNKNTLAIISGEKAIWNQIVD